MSKTRIDHLEKIGIGTWDYNKQGTALSDVEDMGFGWYYNWQTKPLWDNPNDATSPHVDFVPITWGKSDVSKTILEQIRASGENTLLTFNEPDNLSQSNLSVDEALALWPTLMNSGMRLSSPGTTTEQTLGENSWLNKFMQGVETKAIT